MTDYLFIQPSAKQKAIDDFSDVINRDNQYYIDQYKLLEQIENNKQYGKQDDITDLEELIAYYRARDLHQVITYIMPDTRNILFKRMKKEMTTKKGIENKQIVV